MSSENVGYFWGKRSSCENKKKQLKFCNSGNFRNVVSGNFRNVVSNSIKWGMFLSNHNQHTVIVIVFELEWIRNHGSTKTVCFSWLKSLFDENFTLLKRSSPVLAFTLAEVLETYYTSRVAANKINLITAEWISWNSFDIVGNWRKSWLKKKQHLTMF